MFNPKIAPTVVEGYRTVPSQEIPGLGDACNGCAFDIPHTSIISAGCLGVDYCRGVIYVKDPEVVFPVFEDFEPVFEKGFGDCTGCAFQGSHPILRDLCYDPDNTCIGDTSLGFIYKVKGGV